MQEFPYPQKFTFPQQRFPMMQRFLPPERVPPKPIDKRSLETRRRDEGMAEKLGPTNKGFAMLKAMGLEEGKGLGKAGEGRREPIPVKMRLGKKGLGWSKS